MKLFDQKYHNPITRRPLQKPNSKTNSDNWILKFSENSKKWKILKFFWKKNKNSFLAFSRPQNHVIDENGKK